MESMASDLSVISSDIRRNSDLIVNKKGGYLIKPNDVSSISQSIESILINRSCSENMSRENTIMVKKFCITNIIDKFSEVYIGN